MGSHGNRYFKHLPHPAAAGLMVKKELRFHSDLLTPCHRSGLTRMMAFAERRSSASGRTTWECVRWVDDGMMCINIYI